MAKTTKICKTLIDVQEQARLTACEMTAQLDLPAENKQSWFRDETASTIASRMEGMNSMLEVALHNQNCYHGFSYINIKTGGFILHVEGVHVTDQDGFAEWSRRYQVR